VRVFVAALLVLSACAKESEPTGIRDVGSFCNVPASACGRHFVDEKGHVHVMNCAGADAGGE
jgi:hypothetical protein